jgi:hypothetical protein
MNQDLKDYLRAKLDRAEMWDGCCNEEDKKFYQGQIVAYRNVYKEFESKQCNIHVVSFELPSDDIFDKPEVNLRTPLDEFYYYERPAYLEDDQKQFRERLQKALNYLKGN